MSWLALQVAHIARIASESTRDALVNAVQKYKACHAPYKPCHAMPPAARSPGAQSSCVPGGCQSQCPELCDNNDLSALKPR